MSDTTHGFRSGFVALIGRPNVGKSTLMNAMIGEKVAIVSDKPQTTRTRVMGVCTEEDVQLVFLDTPGLHTPRNRLGAYMVKAARDALTGVDALLTLLDATAVGKQDRAIAEEMSQRPIHKVLVLNKIDLLPKENLLALIDSLKALPYDAIMPISARTRDGVAELKGMLRAFMPEGPRYFPDDALTDQPERVLCAELIREKALLHLSDEVPHGIGVEMLGMERLPSGVVEINATIYCERPAHKGIIIGKHGAMLGLIGREARLDIEKLLDARVNLRLWVKVRENWRDRRNDLRTLGYVDEE